MASFSLIQIGVNNQLDYIIYSIFIFLLGIVACGNTLRFKFREQERKEIVLTATSGNERKSPIGTAAAGGHSRELEIE